VQQVPRQARAGGEQDTLHVLRKPV
jgi:hypothetical protein